MVHNDPSSLVRYSNFSFLNRNSRHVARFTKETGDHLLRSPSFTNNFRWIWLVFKDSHGRLQISFGLISIDPRFVPCDAIVFFQNFFAPIRMTFF